jgi:FkbM family methyltransferase
LAREDIVLYVEECGGTVSLSPSSHIFRRIAVYGHYEPRTAELFKTYLDPDRDVMDVGANVGLFTILAAKRLRTGRVVAVEPTDGAYQRLIINIGRNATGVEVIPYKGLVAAAPGEGSVHFVPGLEEYSSMRRPIHPGVAGLAISMASVPTTTIDDLVSEYRLRPALIKADVEGAELLAFQGARETLATHRPVVISELSDDLLRPYDAKCSDVVALFRKFDYEVTVPFNPSSSPERGNPGTVLCIPKERPA